MPIVADAAVAVRGDLSQFNRDLKTGGEQGARTLGQTIKGAFSPRNLAIAGVGAGIAVGTAILGGLTDAARALIEIQRLNAQTDAVIKSTGGAANVTREQIEAAAEAAEATTTIQRESVQEAQNLLLTFTNIRDEVGAGNDIFTQATDAVLDMSVAMGTDARSAAMQLGKALNDPIRGMAQLGRAGVQFTEDQKALVAQLVASGDMLAAQKVILAELETQFGGSAEAFADTTAGKIERFQNDVGNMFESIMLGAVKVADFLGQDVDLWPFDNAEMAAKSGATADATFYAYQQNLIAASAAGKSAIVDAANESLRDPVIEALLGGKEEAERIAGETPGGIAQALLDNQFSVEDAMAELARVAEEALHPMIERAQIIAFLSSAAVAAGVNDGNPIVAAAWREQVALAEARLAELSGDAYFWGLNTAESYAAGLNAGYGYVITAAGNLAAATRSQIGINSEPEDHNSPLYGITKWGGNIVKTIAGGIYSELGMGKGAASALAGSLVPAFGGVGTVSGASAPGTVAGGGNVYHVHLEDKLQARTVTEIGYALRRLGEAGLLPGSLGVEK